MGKARMIKCDTSHYRGDPLTTSQTLYLDTWVAHYIRGFIEEMTRDDRLACGARGCSVVKPTARALSAHRAGCLYFEREKRNGPAA